MNVLELLNNEIIEPLNNEIEIKNIDDLNYELKKYKCSILYVNIRSINANVAMLEYYINCL